MLGAAQVRPRLAAATAAAFRAEPDTLTAAQTWLDSVSDRELLRIDSCARYYPYDGSALGDARRWTARVLDSPFPVVAVLASMHHNGFVRERAVAVLARSRAPLSDRALAVRVTDHVGVVREAAAREVLRRATPEQAARIVPLLHRIEHRGRGSDVLSPYLHSLVAAHGEAEVWAGLRASPDRGTRRLAYRHSVEIGLVGLADAARLLPREDDPIIRRMLAHVVADHGPPEVIADVLLGSGSAEHRALGLVRLSADHLEPATVEPLLLDTSVLVRLWAQRRWRELGHDPAATYAAATRSAVKPTVRARAYLGLTETGAEPGRDEILDLVHSDHPALRKVGLRLLADQATADDVDELLTWVAGDSSVLARLAGLALVRAQHLWSVDDLARLKASPDPELRRRAWWLHRRRGGWETTIADLQILHDPDPRLAALGRNPRPPMYDQPTDAQRRRIAGLLPVAELSGVGLRAFTLAAGLRDLPPDAERT
jgi:hypothetical protein